ncbi:MAG: hypothetical protein AAFO73_04075 [Pseudomonadota bacterium]
MSFLDAANGDPVSNAKDQTPLTAAQRAARTRQENEGKRLSAVRTLYESWGAPLDLLQLVFSTTGSRVFDQAKNEGWTNAIASGALLTKLANILDSQLERFGRDCSTALIDEKSARALSAFAKTVESLSELEQKFRAEANAILSGSTASGDTAAGRGDSYAERSAELDRRLAQLVARYEPDGALGG